MAWKTLEFDTYFRAYGSIVEPVAVAAFPNDNHDHLIFPTKFVAHVAYAAAGREIVAGFLAIVNVVERCKRNISFYHWKNWNLRISGIYLCIDFALDSCDMFDDCDVGC